MRLATFTAVSFAAAWIVMGDAGKSPAGPPAAKPLTATVTPERAEFRTDEPLRFTIKLVNNTDQRMTLPVRDFGGSRTAGAYSARLRNVATGEAWQVRVPASQAPARITQEVLEAGGTLELAYVLPNAFARAADAQPVPRLPAGGYELALVIEVGGLTLTPQPAAFRLVDRAPLTKAETDAIVAQARVALARKLALQAEADRGPAPAAVNWSSLKAERFVATVEPNPNGAMVTFRGDVPGTEQIVTWSVGVSEKGVAADALTQGFVISSRKPPPFPPERPEPN